MLEPVWAGCISASDEAVFGWHRRTGIPLFAWSSQARGFFADRVDPRGTADPVMARSWYSETNFARRDRAARLARHYGVSLSTVALAYVLAQDFPVHPIIGPLTIQELRTSLMATRSEEHTSELQSLMRNSYAVFCLKKKIKTKRSNKN